MKNSKFKINNSKMIKKSLRLCVSAVILFSFVFSAFAQETPPKPGAPKVVTVPAVKEKKLANGLTVAVVERKNVPLVTVQLLVKSGASMEEMNQAGLANMTASLLTKGTKTRSATEIAELIEFLGGSISTGAGWNNSTVVVNVMSDKLPQALEIMSDVVRNPMFKQEEIDLLKSQTLDNLAYNLKQPGFLANYVASRYSFYEHPAGGTPASIENISQKDISAFHAENFYPQNSVLIFTGDITAATANALAQKFFGAWTNSKVTSLAKNIASIKAPTQTTPNKILVVDLPNSGQASVNYLQKIGVGRSGKDFYPASVLNSVLGGGYSARLNQEIRIKRGLSYGAGSSFTWRSGQTNFGTRTQTKNESAAEVAELVLAEVRKLTDSSVSGDELNPRKLVLTGDFGRNLETTQGLAAAVAELYSFGIPTSELNSYMKSVQAINDAQIRDFAQGNILGGDLIIVGDAKIFMDDLKKRFPNKEINVIKADELDLSRDNLRK
jgi:zinc protease